MQPACNLADLRNWKQISTQFKRPIRLGIFGDPVAHSLSPQMQSAALEESGMELRYAPFHVLPNELEPALQLVRELDFIGLNLTVPHKMTALSFVDEIEPAAKGIGAINTVVFREGKSLGCNTDGAGFSRAIGDAFSAELRDLRVLVLGAGGGAGRAIAWQCALERCPRLVLVNRTLARAERLASELAAGHIVAAAWETASLGVALEEIDLVVNATSLGLREDDPCPLPRTLIAPRLMIYDLNYQQTPLLLAATEAGARGANGLTMLLHQGALAFERWFDRVAPVRVMRNALG